MASPLLSFWSDVTFSMRLTFHLLSHCNLPIYSVLLLLFIIYFIFYHLLLAALGLCCSSQALSSWSEWGATLRGQCVGFSLRWLLSLRSTGCRMRALAVVAYELSSCGSQALESRFSRHMSLVAPWHVESPHTRDGTHVPWVGRQILHH